MTRRIGGSRIWFAAERYNRQYRVVSNELPEPISEQVLTFPEVHAGVNRVTVVLADGRTFSGVEVAWGTEIIRVVGHATIPFLGGDVSEVYDASQV